MEYVAPTTPRRGLSRARGRRRALSCRRAVARGDDEPRPRIAGAAGQPAAHRKPARDRSAARRRPAHRRDDDARRARRAQALLTGGALAGPGRARRGLSRRAGLGNDRRFGRARRPGCRLSGGARRRRRHHRDRLDTRHAPSAAQDFFRGLFDTALEKGEIVTAIHLPPGRPEVPCKYEKLSLVAGDFAILSVAAVGDQVVVGGYAPRPLKMNRGQREPNPWQTSVLLPSTAAACCPSS